MTEQAYDDLELTTKGEQQEQKEGFSEVFCCFENSLRARPNGVEITKKLYCCSGRVGLLSDSKVTILREAVNTVGKQFGFNLILAMFAFSLMVTGIIFMALHSPPSKCTEIDVQTGDVLEIDGCNYVNLLHIGLIIFFVAGIYLVYLGIDYFYQRVVIDIYLRSGWGTLMPYRVTFFRANSEKAYNLIYDNLVETNNPRVNL